MFDGGYDKDCAILHRRLGLLFRRLGEYDLAVKMYNVELKMVEKEFGSDHIGMYYPLNNIASVLEMQGKYEEELNTYTKAMAIEEKELECNDLDVVLVVHSNMGHVYRLQREEYDKAIGALNRALAIRKEKLGVDHVHTADALGNIASV
uniref:Kinesin light chain n=1 Tax=Chaetoceros debilis TaxID=122233 RepID=A0A7S3VFE0_9STRA